jgi:hypothetical protein
MRSACADMPARASARLHSVEEAHPACRQPVSDAASLEVVFEQRTRDPSLGMHLLGVEVAVDGAGPKPTSSVRVPSSIEILNASPSVACSRQPEHRPDGRARHR